jgi:hypothetical protein
MKKLIFPKVVFLFEEALGQSSEDDEEQQLFNWESGKM